MPSYTVDDLFTLPENGNRYQVFGPVPDLAVVEANLRGLTGAVPLSATYTVVEVVSPSSALLDRSAKPDLEKNGSVRMVERAAGEEHTFPLAVGADTWVDVTLDPASLDTL